MIPTLRLKINNMAQRSKFSDPCFRIYCDKKHKCVERQILLSVKFKRQFYTEQDTQIQHSYDIFRPTQYCYSFFMYQVALRIICFWLQILIRNKAQSSEILL